MIFFYLSLSTYLIYTLFKYRESLFLLDKNKYVSKKYLKEIKNKKNFINKELIIVILIIIACNFNLKVIEISTIIVYMVLSLLKIKESIAFKKDKKMKPIIALELLLFIILNIWFIIDYRNCHNTKGLIFDNSPIYYIILYLFTYFSYFITLIINIFVRKFDILK